MADQYVKVLKGLRHQGEFAVKRTEAWLVTLVNRDVEKKNLHWLKRIGVLFRIQICRRSCTRVVFILGLANKTFRGKRAHYSCPQRG